MSINIMDILKDHGYEVIKEQDMKVFTLRFTEAHKADMKARGEMWDYDVDADFNIVISEVSFNEAGGLYIELMAIGDKQFDDGDLFDGIEY